MASNSTTCAATAPASTPGTWNQLTLGPICDAALTTPPTAPGRPTASAAIPSTGRTPTGVGVGLALAEPVRDYATRKDYTLSRQRAELLDVATERDVLLKNLETTGRTWSFVLQDGLWPQRPTQTVTKLTMVDAKWWIEAFGGELRQKWVTENPHHDPNRVIEIPADESDAWEEGYNAGLADAAGLTFTPAPAQPSQNADEAYELGRLAGRKEAETEIRSLKADLQDQKALTDKAAAKYLAYKQRAEAIIKDEYFGKQHYEAYLDKLRDSFSALYNETRNISQVPINEEKHATWIAGFMENLERYAIEDANKEEETSDAA